MIELRHTPRYQALSTVAAIARRGIETAAPLGRAVALARVIADACTLFARAVEVGGAVEATPARHRRDVAARLFD